MSKTTIVTSASNGVTFLVRLVEKGDRYGLGLCKIHDEDRPLVEFYDAESRAECYAFAGTREEAIAAGAPRLGQFASRYYVSTLMENIATTSGVCLSGHVPRWTIDGAALREAFQALGLWTPQAEAQPAEATDALLKLVVVYDSNNPDEEPQVWLPRSQAHRFTCLTLNKSQELGGRYPNTDPADIALLEAGTNERFHDYVQLP